MESVKWLIFPFASGSYASQCARSGWRITQLGRVSVSQGEEECATSRGVEQRWRNATFC